MDSSAAAAKRGLVLRVDVARVRGSEAGKQVPSTGSHIHLAELPGCTRGTARLFVWNRQNDVSLLDASAANRS